VILSILICSIHSRHDRLQTLLKELLYQRMDNPLIEILTNIDNKEKSTGKKRQELIEEAKGKYIIFIDDDDWVQPCYISELLKAAESDADCFAINGWITTNGSNKIEWRLSNCLPA
jgi:glycosyltransferase involved in cell wall biosynthesis